MLQPEAMTRPRARVAFRYPECFGDLSPCFDEVAAGGNVGLLSAPLNPSGIEAPDPENGPQLGVTSSGSTGQPKLSWRKWADLMANTRTDPKAAKLRWGSPYRPETFAGCQLALQAWANGTTAASLSTLPEEAWAQIVDQGLNAISCTPTYLYLLLLHRPQTGWEPRQITLGGEPLSTPQGRLFVARLPNCRFTVVYASAEHGVLLKTSRTDGWFEADFLDSCHEWRIESGELQLRSPEGWVSTRDRVERDGRLIRVVGRTDAVANIGGQKFNLAAISRTAEDCPGVLRARAGTEPNPITGQVITLSLTLGPEVGKEQEAEVLRSVQEALRERLPKPAWPRQWMIEQPALGRNSKEMPKCSTQS